MLLPLAGLLLVVALDAALAYRHWPMVLAGLIDEPGHLVTAALLLAALLPWRGRAIAPWALAGSVLLDVDHVPLYWFWPGIAAEGGGRPVTHSLITAAVLLAGAAALTRWRIPLVGLAVGVLLHQLRDLASGPGVPLLFPWTEAWVRVSERSYLAVVAVAAVIATVRIARAVSAARSG
ncbi:Membrane-bound metal-dependent hydrolase [Modestobacter italicus]|uniref:Membrane-bound metal-dependent hydrolase n=1 Tax=Modestobacter italicus (strain DSM 44449 / CECT 9708 / BC 501) TaxID=2732864 RepID=I4ER73_MODI5|nr:Membrane-bound metal-dependent hydrolase [Modestobacter marinus]